MNFIALSSQAKLRDRPHLDAEGVIADQALLDAGVRLLLGHRVHFVLDKIHQAELLLDRLDSRSITGLCGEACALERSDAPIGIGAQLGREGVQGLERALDRSAVGGGLRSQEANPTPARHSKAPSRQPRPRSTSSRLREERAGSEAITGFASAIVARMRGSYHSAVRRLRASASARSSTLVAEGNRARPQRAM